MKKKLLLILGFCAAPLWAWGIAPLADQHIALTHDVIYNPPIINLLQEDGLGYETYWLQQITVEAAFSDIHSSEEQHPQWSAIEYWSAFSRHWGSKEPSYHNLGVLLHNLEDVAIPSGHMPAATVINDRTREAIFETGSLVYGNIDHRNLTLPYYRKGSRIVDGVQIYEDPYFKTSLIQIIESGEVPEGKTFTDLYQEITADFRRLTVAHAKDFKAHFDKYSTLEKPFHTEYTELKPYCADAAFIFAREISYVYLMCHIHNCWNNPDYLLDVIAKRNKKIDMTPINMLLLD